MGCGVSASRSHAGSGARRVASAGGDSTGAAPLPPPPPPPPPAPPRTPPAATRARHCSRRRRPSFSVGVALGSSCRRRARRTARRDDGESQPRRRRRARHDVHGAGGAAGPRPARDDAAGGSSSASGSNPDCSGTDSDGEGTSATSAPEPASAATASAASAASAASRHDRHRPPRGGAAPEGGGVFACGYGYFGQLGQETRASSSVPLRVCGLPPRIVHVACGPSFSLAVDAAGGGWAWGDNMWGQLGVGDRAPRLLPARVAASVPLLACAAGSLHSAFLSCAGAVLTCGSGTNGRLGHGTHHPLATPHAVAGLTGYHIVQVVCGAAFTEALAQTGDLFSFGLNRFGQLGEGRAPCAMFPIPVSSLADAGGRAPNGRGRRRGRVVHAAAGRHHTLLVTRRTHSVYVFGQGTCGALGTRSTASEPRPVAVPELCELRLTDVAAGYYHSVGLSARKQRVLQWGLVETDGIGPPTHLPEGEEFCTVPQRVPTVMLDAPPARVFAGGWHSALITTSGRVHVWGHAHHGRLGLGGALTDDAEVLVPTPVPSLAQETCLSVACGGAHTLFVVRNAEGAAAADGGGGAR